MSYVIQTPKAFRQECQWRNGQGRQATNEQSKRAMLLEKLDGLYGSGMVDSLLEQIVNLQVKPASGTVDATAKAALMGNMLQSMEDAYGDFEDFTLTDTPGRVRQVNSYQGRTGAVVAYDDGYEDFTLG